ncbi:MAG: distant relative of cell wall-associated hydrolase [Burkholderiales bacterium]|jgi:cell wall-associated NlpC family hydrolase|nr:distant relative of cell wall-associated hydrolase [Burkholderiales bacterium]
MSGSIRYATSVLSLGLFVLSFVLVSGCATQTVSAENAPMRFQIQQRALTPKNGPRDIEEAALQTGDILLSADDNDWISLGIRLVSLSPVSHAAVYIGNGNIVEAVRSGVLLGTVTGMRDEQTVIAVYRYPNLDDTQRDSLRQIALWHVGNRYSMVGVVLQAPFMLTRRLCEMPVFPGQVRYGCYHTLGVIQMPPLDTKGLFCSQFVLETFRQAGLPLTDAASRWVSPDDIMHMREGDVPSFNAKFALEYVGHLKARPPQTDPETAETLFVTRQTP